ncbi:MAG: hypothetical protein IKN71_04925 [Alphaproteobacteria bacterium]|nr:hypothetical protein [Alphaproteobacteria bacterium]
MVKIIKIENRIVDNGHRLQTEHTADGGLIETYFAGDNAYQGKNTNPDGSFQIWRMINGAKVVTEEKTADGIHNWYNPQTKKLSKTEKGGIITTFFENERVESIIDEKGNGVRYYENGNLYCKCEDGYELSLDADGRKQYEYKDGKLTINPDYFSYYRLGVKTAENEQHWTEKTTLDPKKKTLLCLGGDQSKDARAANGNIVPFARVLGFSDADMAQMQLVSCYRPVNLHVNYLRRSYKGEEDKIKKDYKREVLQKFLPFMAREIDGKFERLRPDELLANFRNIIVQAHCYGANDLPRFAEVLQNTMTKLGYAPKLQKQAMRQILCITNNTQRELTDKLDFTLIHRYSVADGQFEPEYDRAFSDAYPVFVQDHKRFSQKYGTKASFIQMRPNEMLMVFTKMIKSGNEHNEGFGNTDNENFTAVGKKQFALMKQLGNFWLNNRAPMPKVADLLRQCLSDTATASFVESALLSGKKLKTQKRNVLENHHILKAAYNRFKSNSQKPDKTGVYKLLSEKYHS